MEGADDVTPTIKKEVIDVEYEDPAALAKLTKQEFCYLVSEATPEQARAWWKIRTRELHRICKSKARTNHRAMHWQLKEEVVLRQDKDHMCHHLCTYSRVQSSPAIDGCVGLAHNLSTCVGPSRE